jgi:putative ABC transport system permease protein
LTSADRSGSPQVAVLSEAAAVRLFGNRDPTSKVVFGPESDSGLQVVGVVPNVNLFDPRMPSAMLLFVPIDQATEPLDEVTVVASPVTTSESVLSGIDALIRSINAYPAGTSTLGRRVDRLLWRERVLTGVTFTCSLFAVAIALVGLSALLRQAVERGRRERAIRAALGASPRRLAAGILRDSAGPACAGCVVAVPLTLWCAYALRHLAGPELARVDPWAFAVCVAFAVVVSVVVALPPLRAVALEDAAAFLRVDYSG